MSAPARDEVAVQYTSVTFSYPRSAGADSPRDPHAPVRTVLDNITMAVRTGERLGILGPNGGGKSTLLKLTLGLLKPSHGSITVMGMTPERARTAGLIGYVPQRIEAELAFPLSVLQVVTMAAARGLMPWQRVPPDRAQWVRRCLELVGASDLAEKPIGALSGGQLQRVMIARALAGKPRILFLDEPTVGIDVAGQQRFADLVRTINSELGLTIITVSHDIRTIAAGSDRVACLSRTLHFHDAPRGLTPTVLAEVFRHDVAGIFGDVHVDAHLASQCSDPAHAHAPVTLTIHKPAPAAKERPRADD